LASPGPSSRWPAGQRAGRLGLYFLANAADRSLEAAYREAADAASVRPLGCRFMDPDVPLSVFVADDPEKAWAEIGEYLLLDAVGDAVGDAVCYAE
jgi:alkanesulfonate monooxygenase SsuD/methylene tetrahydromethanopterin reductase-like flavin-dependent oxidoreductase (luciferase family)